MNFLRLLFPKKHSTAWGAYHTYIHRKNFAIRHCLIEKDMSYSILNTKSASVLMFLSGRGKMTAHTRRRIKEKYVGEDDFVLTEVGTKYVYNSLKKTKLIQVDFGKGVK